MSTSVTITGSGVPMLAPGRAGPGALVKHNDIALQVDAGRATALRLAEEGTNVGGLTAMLITHHHSDHLLGITDIIITRWAANGPRPYATLPIHCPRGPIVDYLEHLLDHLEPDIQSRIAVSGYPSRPEPDIHVFESSTAKPTPVGTFGDLSVDSIAVDHGDLSPAVAYRFTSPDGVIVISGDTAVCPQLEEFAKGADVLVHEAFSRGQMEALGMPPSRLENITHHHADASAVGAMAARLEVPTLVLTHMVPSPTTAAAKQSFVDEVRSGGYQGDLTIAEDLNVAAIG